MIPNKEHIELLDKMLLFWMDKTRPWSPTTSLFAKENKISVEMAELVYIMFCEIGNELEILVAKKTGYGEFGIGRINELQAKYFINQGGFEKYYQCQEEYEQRIDSNLTIINTGNIESLIQSQGDKTFKNSTIKKSNNKEPKNSWLEKWSWVASILSAIKGIFGLLILYFKSN